MLIWWLGEWSRLLALFLAPSALTGCVLPVLKLIIFQLRFAEFEYNPIALYPFNPGRTALFPFLFIEPPNTMILLYQFLLIILLYSTPNIQCQTTCRSGGPQRYSDFNIVQLHSTLYLTGGNPVRTKEWFTLALTHLFSNLYNDACIDFDWHMDFEFDSRAGYNSMSSLGGFATIHWNYTALHVRRRIQDTRSQPNRTNRGWRNTRNDERLALRH
jgi:hypothetical protein